MRRHVSRQQGALTSKICCLDFVVAALGPAISSPASRRWCEVETTFRHGEVGVRSSSMHMHVMLRSSRVYLATAALCPALSKELDFLLSS